MALTFRERCQAAQRGDSAAYEATFAVYHDLVFRVAYRIVGDAHVAEDVLQDTAAVALRANTSFESAVPLRVWMLRTALNLANRYVRQKRTHLALPADDVQPVPDRHAGPERELEAKEESAAVRLALGKLSEDDNAALALHAEDLARAAIAEILGCTTTAVGPRLFHARDRFHAALRRVDADLAARFPRRLRRTSVGSEDGPVSPNPETRRQGE